MASWTGEEVHAECGQAHREYQRRRSEQYRAYFRANDHQRDQTHEYKASDIAAALPDGWGELAELIPANQRHRHHLSGNSSQLVALGILGVSWRRKTSLHWLENALGALRSSGDVEPDAQFEYELDPRVLDESPFQTNIDFFVSGPTNLICIECKWTEVGIGACSCRAPAPLTSDCSEKVLKREAYWRTARDIFGLPERVKGRPCSLSFTYQAVRNVAAAQALAQGDQDPVFGLIYDAENPYFTRTGEWPGWPAALEATLNEAGSPVKFRSVSWQVLVQDAPLDAAAAAWASEKHGLDKATAAEA